LSTFSSFFSSIITTAIITTTTTTIVVVVDGRRGQNRPCTEVASTALRRSASEIADEF